MYSDPLEDFRTNFYKMIEDEKIEKQKELKRKQKNCFHKYTKTIPYSSVLVLGVCKKCSHAKLFNLIQ